MRGMRRRVLVLGAGLGEEFVHSSLSSFSNFRNFELWMVWLLGLRALAHSLCSPNFFLLHLVLLAWVASAHNRARMAHHVSVAWLLFLFSLVIYVYRLTNASFLVSAFWHNHLS